jgi:hypothetical protein
MKGERITEVFTTNISSAKVPENDVVEASKVFIMKYKQLQAYCYMSGEYKGDLLVFFLMGDYNRFVDVMGSKKYKGITPQLRCFTYEFEEKDLLANWNKMNDNLEDIIHAQKTGEMPLACGEKWECSSCGFAYTCLGEEPKGEPVGDIPFTGADLK